MKFLLLKYELVIYAGEWAAMRVTYFIIMMDPLVLTYYYRAELSKNVVLIEKKVLKRDASFQYYVAKKTN